MLGCVMATVNLLFAKINGSKQRRSVSNDQLREDVNSCLSVLTPKHPKLDDKELIDLCNSRSGWSTVEQAQKRLALRQKLKRYLLVVERYKISGNSNDVDKMRCA